jgi:hypothetical protein
MTMLGECVVDCRCGLIGVGKLRIILGEVQLSRSSHQVS